MQQIVDSIHQQFATENANIVKRRIRRQPSSFSFYDPIEFQRAVVLLSKSFNDGKVLTLSHSYLPQQYVRKRVYQQLGVKLSRHQMKCLCYKLQNSYTKRNTICHIESTESDATAVLSLCSMSSEDSMRESPIDGEVFEKFYTQLHRYLGDMPV